ncbi:hypothetical protein [Mycobacteroides stephanolepidis]|uniref:hypothetical protein n=1 Tax=[Mycobacterium] stephanolepidis TaxID=1520670 RepID=UPI0013007818|nr:hypothetical protein [[Mycobacterium] stephanolepidis]
MPAEVLQQLQSKSIEGELGSDMRSAATLVASGQETWSRLFSGVSPNSGLLVSHINKMVAENAAAAQGSVSSDPACQPPPGAI